METSLTGSLILIAEDEPRIAFEIMQGFEDEGARVIMSVLGGTVRGLLVARATQVIQPFVLEPDHVLEHRKEQESDDGRQDTPQCTRGGG